MNIENKDKTMDQLIQEAKKPGEAGTYSSKEYLIASAGVCQCLGTLAVAFLILGSLIAVIMGTVGGAIGMALGIELGSVVGCILFYALRAIIMELRYIRLDIEAR